MNELGMQTRRRPIGRDYAAAKDAEGGKKARRLSNPEGFEVDLCILESFFENKQIKKSV
jgi:hypothetical protein